MNIDELNTQSNEASPQSVPSLNYETPSAPAPVSVQPTIEPAAPAVAPVAPVAAPAVPVSPAPAPVAAPVEAVPVAPVTPAVAPTVEPAPAVAPVAAPAVNPGPEMVQVNINSMPELNFETPLESLDSAVANQSASLAQSQAQTQEQIDSFNAAYAPETAPAVESAPVTEASPMVETAPVVDSAPVAEAPVVQVAPTAAPTEVVPMPAQTTTTDSVVVVSNEKRKTASNFILIVLALGLVAFVFFIDEVIDYFETNILPNTPFASKVVNNNTNSTGSDNLVDGFIKIDDSSSFFWYEKIKFYNIVKSGNSSILVGYLSDKNYNDVSVLGLNIELYNSEKELLYRTEFKTDGNRIENNAASTITFKVAELIYNSAYYAKIVTYTDEEKNSTQTLTCSRDDKNEDYLLNYKNVYTFKNNNLVSYDVSVKLEGLNNNKNTKNVKNYLSKENTTIQKYEIQTTYEEVDKNASLSYTIDLSNVNESYNLLYEKDATPIYIKTSENSKEKKWICE